MIKTFHFNEFGLNNSFIHISQASLEDDFVMHTHDFTELMILLSGSVIHIIDGEEYPIHEGEICIIKENTSHGFKNPDNAVICNIMYNSDRCFESHQDLLTIPGFQALFTIEQSFRDSNGYKSMLHLTPDCIHFIRPILSNMIYENVNKTAGSDSLLHVLFIQLVIYLSRQYEQSGTKKLPHIMGLARAVSYIESHYMTDLSLDELAGIANLSVRHFRRLFIKHYHTAPIDYINGLRIDSACNYLINSSLTISEIGFEVGYNDSNYFSRIFRKQKGLSPSAFRKHYTL